MPSHNLITEKKQYIKTLILIYKRKEYPHFLQERNKKFKCEWTQENMYALDISVAPRFFNLNLVFLAKTKINCKCIPRMVSYHLENMHLKLVSPTLFWFEPTFSCQNQDRLWKCIPRMVSMVISVVKFQVWNYKINSGLDRNSFFTAMEKSPFFQIRNIDEVSVWAVLTINSIEFWIFLES